VLATDIRFAGDKAIPGHPEVSLGSVPGGGPMIRLIGRGRAAEILLGADDIPAELAERYGFVNRVLPDAGLARPSSVCARRPTPRGPCSGAAWHRIMCPYCAAIAAPPVRSRTCAST
jgi:enoyl-CoA hydratase/carnithine racemase